MTSFKYSRSGSPSINRVSDEASSLKSLEKYPKLNKIRSFMVTLPKNIFVRMTGSGSSIVAYFHSQKDCSNAYGQFKRKFNSHWCIESKTI